MNTYIKSMLITAFEWFGVPAFIYFLFWNPFGWNFEIINPTTMTTSFWVIVVIVSVAVFVISYTVIIGWRNRVQKVWINHYEDDAQSAKTDNRPRIVRNMTFRDTLFSMLHELRDALDKVFWSEEDSLTQITILSWREIFLSLDMGSIVYNGRRYEINKNAWFDEWGRKNILDIIEMIKKIEEYIENPEVGTDGKEFYFNLLRSFFWKSEMKIIREVLENTDTTLKVFE